MHLVIRDTTGLRLRQARPRRIQGGPALARAGEGALLLLLLVCGALQGGLLLALVGLATLRGLGALGR